ncbi:MAG: hypothetical protein K2K31_02160, partial [Clostridia bacterium]|nr:hypothetical protein [Clostridia bacterium]
GVDIAEDGFFVVPYISEHADFRNYEKNLKIEDSKVQLTVMTCDGTFNGVLLYSDEAFNACVIKCERMVDKDKPISLPYLNIASAETTINVQNVLFVSPVDDEDFYNANARDTFVSLYNEVLVDDKIAMDYLIQGCIDVDVSHKNASTDMENKTTRVCCDYSGYVIGFSSYYLSESEDEVGYDTNFVFMPIYGARSFFDDVVDAYRENKAYTNDLVKQLTAFDHAEIESYMLVALDNKPAYQNDFCYKDKNTGEYTSHPFSDGMKNFDQSDLNGVYLFDNFVYGQNKQIDADSVIVGVTVNGREYEVSGKIDFLSILYSMESGDNVTFKYYRNFADLNVENLKNSDMKTVTWTI